MDLPTYTNIWRIEKRLYKLYDFRLPAPLPINWIAVFAGITVPYIVLLVAIGLPFNHTLVWLYVLPPGVLTWLTTRPVIESKRLPELLESQIRYLTEPRVWCRLAPLSEKDQIVVTVKVWHSRRVPRAAQRRGAGAGVVALRERGTLAWRSRGAAPFPVPEAGTATAARGPAPALPAAVPAATAVPSAPAAPSVRPRGRTRVQGAGPRVRGTGSQAPAPDREPGQRSPARGSQAPPPWQRLAAAQQAPASQQAPETAGQARPAGQPRPGRPVWLDTPPLTPVAAPVPSAMPPHATPDASPEAPVPEAPVAAAAPAREPDTHGAPPIEVAHADPARRPAEPRQAQPPAAKAGIRPPLPKTTAGTRGEHAVPSIERALSGPSKDRNLSWHGKVKIVTGAGAAPGPGARDQEALDRARARLPLKAPMRILVLGCTSGAGQTVTTLMTGHILASLRDHPVAAVDLHDGTLARYRSPAASLEEVLRGKPPRQHTAGRPDGLHPSPKASPARLDVIAPHDMLRDGDEIKLAVQLNRHYQLTMLDPGPAGLTKLLKITDQLVVVVPASAEASSALADTRDWLDAHGFADLAAHSVTLINGVSRRSLPDVEHAESVARGRCRAIVRVPWDDMLPPVEAAGPSTLRPQTRVAYTALAGVLVAGMAAAPVRARR